MKTYLTENGLLIVRDDASFFTSNSGKFRRLATQDEVEYLTKQVIVPMCSPAVGLPLVDIGPVDCSKEGISGIVMHATLIRMEIPLWHYLWTARTSDYSSYKPETCNNGGDYTFHTDEHFFARCIDGVWEVRVLETHSTSAEFGYDELAGSFQSNLSEVKIIGMTEAPFDCVLTQSSNDEEVIDKLFTEERYTIEEAILAKDYEIPEKDSEDEEGFRHLNPDEAMRRAIMADNMGIITPQPKQRSSGRNHRRV